MTEWHENKAVALDGGGGRKIIKYALDQDQTLAIHAIAIQLTVCKHVSKMVGSSSTGVKMCGS
jgi:hypothetical protein